MKDIKWILLLLIVIFSCNKNETCPSYVEIKASIRNPKLEYKIGDTIYLDSKFHHNIKGFNIEEKYVGEFDMKNIKWFPYTLISKTDTFNYSGSYVDLYFQFLKDTLYDYNVFKASNGESMLYGEYNYVNDSFNLTIKLIPLKVGTYFLRQNSDIMTPYRNQQDFPGKCGLNGIDIWTSMNEGLNTNFDLLKESPDSGWSVTTVQATEKYNVFYRSGGFCFKVVQ